MEERMSYLVTDMNLTLSQVLEKTDKYFPNVPEKVIKDLYSKVRKEFMNPKMSIVDILEERIKKRENKKPLVVRITDCKVEIVCVIRIFERLYPGVSAKEISRTLKTPSKNNIYKGSCYFRMTYEEVYKFFNLKLDKESFSANKRVAYAQTTIKEEEKGYVIYEKIRNGQRVQ